MLGNRDTGKETKQSRAFFDQTHNPSLVSHPFNQNKKTQPFFLLQSAVLSEPSFHCNSPPDLQTLFSISTTNLPCSPPLATLHFSIYIPYIQQLPFTQNFFSVLLCLVKPFHQTSLLSICLLFLAIWFCTSPYKLNRVYSTILIAIFN